MSRNDKRASTMAVNAERPYRPSWLNRLIYWIESRPGSVWPYYLAGFILSGLISAVARWMLGNAPGPGSQRHCAASSLHYWRLS